MKFPTEKKSTLCIYTEAGYPADKMECEVAALRCELEETRAALKLQTVRCRQLVAAFSSKLRQKEQEARAGRELNDQQLSRVLSALLVLEARLRREQRAIQRQLQERDAVIRSQTLEIARLRRAAAPHRPQKKSPPVETDGGYHTMKSKRGHDAGDDHGVTRDRRPFGAAQPPADENHAGGTKYIQDDGYRTEEATDATYTTQESSPKQIRSSLHKAEPTEEHVEFVHKPSPRAYPDQNLLDLQNVDGNTAPKLWEGSSVDVGNKENPCNGRDQMVKTGSKRFIKHQVSRVSDSSLNRFKISCQKDLPSTEGVEFSGRFANDASENKFDEQLSQERVENGLEGDNVMKNDSQDSYQEPDEELPSRDLYKDYQHNPVLECVNQILLRDQEDMEYQANKPEDLKKGRYSYQCPSIQEEQEAQEEEEEEEERNINNERAAESKDSASHENTPPEIKDTAPTSEAKCDQMKWRMKDKTPSPPIKAQHLQEKACLMMSTKGLTLVRNLELEEVDKKDGEEENKGKVIYQKAKNANIPPGRSLVPPALPPKPPQLGSMCRLRHKRNMFNAQLNQNSLPHHSGGPHDTKPPSANHSSENHCREASEKGLDSLIKAAKSCDIQMHYSHPIYQEKPRQRQILSNGSLKRALNQEHLAQEARQYTLKSGHDHQESVKTHPVKSFEEKLDDLNLSAYHPHPRHAVKVVGPVATRVQRQLEARPAEEKAGAIRVGCSVSSLITGSTGGSIVTELTQGGPQEQDGNDALRRNFEEFRLENVDMDMDMDNVESGRPAGDGAEARGAQTSQNGGSYEHFLESTGLSQKSIMTPSRMFSNHRSVLKPKDVKHRSRVLKAAAVSERCGTVGTAPGPIVKYWVEPFL